MNGGGVGAEVDLHQDEGQNDNETGLLINTLSLPLRDSEAFRGLETGLDWLTGR